MSYDLDIPAKTSATHLCKWRENIRGDPNLLKPLIKEWANAVKVDQTSDLQIFSLTLFQLSYPRFLLLPYKITYQKVAKI
ncbi:hypothetical protein DVH24_025287 [Malus domestica]|uniref:Uncharacterized protein n=1 Tax=Malus domestica TaxID=3750 RepID=A0A498HJY6_MALDO|nr:hypothetical protein DVH24_025287 [Malus domestica]